MTDSPSNLCEIYRFRAIGEKLGTAGQPTESQFRTIQDCGFKTVVNLALTTSDNAISNEGEAVTDLRMSYVHIPVNFEAPTSYNFKVFCRVMGAFGNGPMFVHCAANLRVSAFVFLYRVIFQDVPIAESEPDLHAIWQPDEVWSQFIQNELKNHKPVPNEQSPPPTTVGALASAT
jgi:protein tyrosine phosphatase (PTP) superfamily phosphohydrolase (DUF442 family)